MSTTTRERLLLLLLLLNELLSHELVRRTARMIRVLRS